MSTNKSKKIAIIATSIVALGGVIAGGVYLATNHEPETVVVSSTTTDSSQSTDVNQLQEGKNKITSGGTYFFSGSVTNGKIIVDTTEEVKIILDGVSITNPDGAAIKCKEGSNVTIELKGENTLASTDKGDSSNDPSNAISSDGQLTFIGDGSVNITANGKGIKAETALNLTSGTFKITTADDAIHSNGNLVIDGGTYTLQTEDDAIHAEGLVEINDGNFNITAHEAIEGTYVKINGGTFNISASDDGINAANNTSDYPVKIEINGGDITINMGQGDTDAIDSNGDISINGGTLNINAQSPFDYDGKAEYTGGTIIVNGEKTTEITNHFMSGGMQGGGMQEGGRTQQRNEASMAR